MIVTSKPKKMLRISKLVRVCDEQVFLYYDSKLYNINARVSCVQFLLLSLSLSRIRWSGLFFFINIFHFSASATQQPHASHHHIFTRDNLLHSQIIRFLRARFKVARSALAIYDCYAFGIIARTNKHSLCRASALCRHNGSCGVCMYICMYYARQHRRL